MFGSAGLVLMLWYVVRELEESNRPTNSVTLDSHAVSLRVQWSQGPNSQLAKGFAARCFLSICMAGKIKDKNRSALHPLRWVANVSSVPRTGLFVTMCVLGSLLNNNATRNCGWVPRGRLPYPSARTKKFG